MTIMQRLIIVAVALFWTSSAWAQDCCPYCGCREQIHRVCRVKCEMKKVPKVTYCCEAEDFCIGDRSKICGYTCEVDCDGCKHYKENRTPCGAKMFCRKKLVKTVVDKEVPVYTWVVEYMCDRCAAEAEKPEDSTATASLKETEALKQSSVAASKPAAVKPGNRVEEKRSLIRRASAEVEESSKSPGTARRRSK